MADWTTISALATAGGTLVLAAATFAAVRSANQSARITERALLAGIRPVLVTSRLQDPPEKVGFVDDRWFKVEAGFAVAEVTDEAIYLVFGLRNVGTGLAVLDRWDFLADADIAGLPHRDPDDFAGSHATCMCPQVTSASGRERSVIRPSRSSPRRATRSRRAGG